MKLDPSPCKNLLSKDKKIKATLFFSIYEVNPKSKNDVPIINIPNTIKFLLPILGIKHPTNGLPIITASEYTENIYPIQD